MKVLITGGAGFLGTKLTEAFLKRGDEVRWLVRHQREESLLPKGGVLTQCVGDLDNLESLRKACEGVDWVVHAAGLISYNPQKAELMRKTNVEGTKAVAEAALRAKLKRFLHVSSTAAIGVSYDPQVPMNEESPFNARPLGLAYFDTKFDAEQEVLRLVPQGLDAVIVNPGSLLGPGDTRRYEKGYAGLIYKYKPPFLFHGGINFVDVDDVVRGIFLALEKGKTGERYILGGENLDFGAMIVRVNTILGRPSPKKYVPVGLMGALSVGLRGLNMLGVDLHFTPELVRQVCSWYLFVDSSKAKHELGWEPHRIDRSIASTIEWLKQIGRIQ